MKKVYNKIYAFLGDYETISYYIDDKKKVLIDASIDPERSIDLLILTHCHYDHIKYANKLKKKYNCKIFIGQDAKHIEKMDDYTVCNLFGDWLEPIKVDKVLKEGDMINTGVFKLKVLHTPGHTEGSICLYEPKYEILFSGDTGKRYRTDFSGGNKQEMLKSIEKLKRLKIKYVFEGH